MRKLLAVVGVLLTIGVIALFLFLDDERASTPESPSASADDQDNAAADARMAEARQRISTLSWSEAVLQDNQGDKTLRGRVDALDGSPVPGALVVATVAAAGETLSELECQCDNRCGKRLLSCGCGEAHGQIVELVGERRGESIPVARAITREDGTFELTGLDDRALTLWAEKAGVGVGLKAAVVPGADVAIALAAAKTLEGKVVDEDGKAVRGAIVTAIFSEHSRFFDAVTDEAGRFSYSLLPEGSFRLVSVAEPLLPETEFATAGQDSLATIEMSRPRFISGRVESSGVPVTGAQVSLDGEHRKETVTTDQEGAFRFEGLRKGDYELVATQGGLKARAESEVAKDDVVEVVLSLGRPRIVEGTVTGEDGAPVEDARVSARAQGKDIYSDFTLQDTRTDAQGAYRIEVFTDGAYGVRATAKGFLDGHSDTTLTGDGATARVDFRLERGQVLRGRIVDESGRGIADAEIRLTPDFMALSQAMEESPESFDRSVFRRARPASGESNEQGEFTIEGLIASHPYNYAVTAEGFVSTAGSIKLPSRDVRWVLDRGASITGVVLDAAGTPMPGVRVFVEAIEAGGKVNVTWSREASTDANGHFALEGLKGGEYLLLANRNTGPKERPSTSTASARVRVLPRQSTETVLRFDGAYELHGIALTDDGEPIEGAHLILRASVVGVKEGLGDARGWSGFASTRSGPDGAFILTGVREGPHVLGGWAEGYGNPKQLEVTIPASNPRPVEVRFARVGKLVGRVVGEDGQALTKFSLNNRARSDPGGKFEVPVSRDGLIELVIGAPGYATADRRIQVVANQVTEVGDVRLERGRTLRGTVLNGAGTPVEGALVDVGPLGHAEKDELYLSEHYGAVRSDAAGRFELPNVGAEPRLLVVDHDDYPQHRRTLAPEVSEVSITLAAGGTVKGFVALRDGRPAVGARIDLLGNGDSRDARVGADGTFTITAVPTGTAYVSVRARPELPTYFTRTLEIREGSTSTVDFKPVEGSCDVTVALEELSEPSMSMAILVTADTPPIQTFGPGIMKRSAAQALEREGAVTFEAVPPGSYRLEVYVMQQTGALLVERAVQVAAPCPPTISVSLEGARALSSEYDAMAADYDWE